MNIIQEIFSNREIAVGLWVIGAVVLFLLKKTVRTSIKTIIPMLFCKKFVVFYVIAISYLSTVLYLLNYTELWDYNLLKDTVFWVLFAELPLFIKTIEKGDGAHFFGMIIKENVTVAAIIDFFIGFWTFGFMIELMIVPFLFLVSALYAVASSEKKYSSVKSILDVMFVLLGGILLVYAIRCVTSSPETFFNMNTLKSFLLPIVLLFFNLPVIYGLALYNMYEQVFIRIKGEKDEQRKMKWQVLFFAGVNLYRVAAIRKNLPSTIVFCKSSKELEKNLANLSRRLELQIGDNYMKRSHYYLFACIVGGIISLVGLIAVNCNVSLKDIATLKFVFDVHRIKEIMTYIFSTSIVFSIGSLIYAIGFNKKQREDITQIKKYALYELLCSAKRQQNELMEYPPLEEPEKLFDSYVLNAYDIRVSCDKVLVAYENLLTTWEQETVRNLKFSAITVSDDFGIREENVNTYTKAQFCDFYNNKIKTAPQSDKINTYAYTVKRDLEKYSNRVNQFCEEFKYCYKE